MKKKSKSLMLVVLLVASSLVLTARDFDDSDAAQAAGDFPGWCAAMKSHYNDDWGSYNPYYWGHAYAIATSWASSGCQSLMGNL